MSPLGLIAVANSYFDGKREPAKVHAYAAKVVDIMSAKPKPEGMSDADWQNREVRFPGVANFKMEKVQEAANFNRECAALKSQFTGLCTKNLAAIRSQYRGVK